MNILSTLFINKVYTLPYILGRFFLFRIIFRKVNRFRNIKKPKKIFRNYVLFKKSNKEIIEKLNNDGYYDNLQLKKHSVNRIISSIKKKRIFFADKTGTYYGTLKKPIYLKKQKIHVPRAFVEKVKKISEIKKISKDKRIIEIFYEYFGYYPKIINPLIFVNYPVKLREIDRIKFEASRYHFDMESPNSLYLNIYLCDVDNFNAPHALIKKTHKAKPLKFVLKGAAVNAKDIFEYYKCEDELVLKFSSGKGFLEDAHIYHKNFPSKKKKRIMLQIRYY